MDGKAHTTDLRSTPSRDSEPPPDYDDEGPSKHLSHDALHFVFPPVMSAYAQWGQFKTFNLCGANDSQPLCLVEVHTGFSGEKPLGSRPGIHLHNGMSKKDLVLAAAGDELQIASRAYSFNLESTILLPQPGPLGAPRVEGLVTEMMQARIRDDKVSFIFSIEIGQGEKIRREHFEWRKFDKGDEDSKAGGFRLLWLSAGRSSDVGDHCDGNISPSAANEAELVALLSWSKGLASLKHAFTLKLLGSGLSDTLGERWKLMVVVTALRLWYLKANGRTTKAVVAIGEKIHGQ